MHMVEQKKPGRPRTYRMSRRREQLDAMSQRIAEAAFELHGTVGPAQTSISAVAERAGVQRHTVYHHFPDLGTLFRACTDHGMRVTRTPEAAPWRAIDDPTDRLRHGLDELYAYYRANTRLLGNILRDMPFMAVVGGSEAALIQSFISAQQNKTPLLAYFYEPQWFFSEMKLVKVNLPKYTTGCDAVAAKVACDYPPYHLNKLISTKFANSGSPAVTLIKNFHWTNDDQNLVSTYIAKDGMQPAAAAQKWIAANPSVVSQWLQGTGAS